jgi:hypothetical protein
MKIRQSFLASMNKFLDKKLYTFYSYHQYFLIDTFKMDIRSWLMNLEGQLNIIIHNNRFLRAIGLRRIKILIAILLLLVAFSVIASSLTVFGFQLTTELQVLNNTNFVIINLKAARYVISVKLKMNMFDFGSNKVKVEEEKIPTDIVSRRGWNVSRNCANMKWIMNSILSLEETSPTNIFIDDKNKFLFCSVPANGAMSWRRVIIKMTGKTNKTNLMDIPGDKLFETGMFKQLNQLSRPEIQKVINEYTKVMVIREPMERLLFLYLSKFKQKLFNEFYRNTYDKPIIQHTRKDVPADQLDKLHDVTFEELLKFILLVHSPYAEEELLDFRYHDLLKSMIDFCHPCVIKYNKIIEFDHLTAESNFVLSSIGSRIRFPIKTATAKTREQLQKYYDSLPEELVEKIFKHYENDLKLFEYI